MDITSSTLRFTLSLAMLNKARPPGVILHSHLYAELQGVHSHLHAELSDCCSANRSKTNKPNGPHGNVPLVLSQRASAGNSHHRTISKIATHPEIQNAKFFCKTKATKAIQPHTDTDLSGSFFNSRYY